MRHLSLGGHSVGSLLPAAPWKRYHLTGREESHKNVSGSEFPYCSDFYQDWLGFGTYSMDHLKENRQIYKQFLLKSCHHYRSN